MQIRSWRPARHSALAGVLALVLVLATSQAAFAATPAAPSLRTVYPSGSNQVTLQWLTSVDASPTHTVSYEIYRSKAPITQTMLTPALSPLVSLVSTMSLTSAEPTWTAVVNADVAGGEVADAYVWFYAVRAKDDQPTPAYSTVSSTMSPNLHGYRSGSNIDSCQRCHNVHGAPTPPGIVDRSSWTCYYCHGRADGNTSSTIGDRSTIHTKTDFYDYPAQTFGSKHRGDIMTTNNQQCRACHSPHRSSYYFTSPDGTTLVYDPLQSFRKMLRVQTGVDGTGKPTYTNGYYSRNDDTSENTSFCFSCHGSTTASPADGSAATNMGYVSSGGFSATGGDHNEAGYAAAAHGPAVLYSNDDGKTNESDYPQVQCLACHDKHASAADKLIAYRGDDAAGAYAQAELCFACHSASTTESKVAGGYTSPFSWNDRDVEAQFALASKHPTVTSATGRSLTCANCHNVHRVSEGGATAWSTTRASTPSNTNATPANTTAFCLDCHDGDPASPQIDATTLVPYRIGFSAPSPAPYFASWDKSKIGADATLGFDDSGHYAASVANGKALCENCHDPHASAAARLLAWYRPSGVTWSGGLSITGDRSNTANAGNTIAKAGEELLCYKCHGNGTAAYPRSNGARDVYTDANRTYKHPIGTNGATGIHADTEDYTNLSYAASNSKRHSECTDCHDPHTAQGPANSVSAVHAVYSSVGGGALYGVVGINPNYGAHSDTSNWTVPVRTTFSPIRLIDDTTSYEAYLCFKCHSSNTTLNTAVYTDQALEFNPSNFSEHNVLGQSTAMEAAFTVGGTSYSMPLPAMQFQGSWTRNSAMTCTDCHTGEAGTDPTTEARGPHGSSVQWVIDPDFPTNWRTTYLQNSASGMSNTTNICAKCHTNIDASNNVHSFFRHQDATNGDCNGCHVGIPHGWKRPRLLGYRTDGVYATTALTAIELRNYTSATNWSGNDCSTAGGCTQHSGASPVWP